MAITKKEEEEVAQIKKEQRKERKRRQRHKDIGHQKKSKARKAYN